MRMVGADGVISSFFLWKQESGADDGIWNEIDIEVLDAPVMVFRAQFIMGKADGPIWNIVKLFIILTEILPQDTTPMP